MNLVVFEPDKDYYFIVLALIDLDFLGTDFYFSFFYAGGFIITNRQICLIVKEFTTG
jgi:hypothetical protein